MSNSRKSGNITVNDDPNCRDPFIRRRTARAEIEEKNNFSANCRWQFSFVKDWICKHSISRNLIFLPGVREKNRMKSVSSLSRSLFCSTCATAISVRRNYFRSQRADNELLNSKDGNCCSQRTGLATPRRWTNADKREIRHLRRWEINLWSVFGDWKRW